MLNRVAVVRLAGHLRSGRVVAEAGDPGFSVPTTAAEYRHDLYLVNAGFGTPVMPTTPYWVTKIRKP